MVILHSKLLTFVFKSLRHLKKGYDYFYEPYLKLHHRHKNVVEFLLKFRLLELTVKPC